MTYKCSSFTAVLIVIYLHCLSRIKSQYSTIWYDPMENCNNWSDGPRVSGVGILQCGYDSTGCQSNPCVLMASDDTYGSRFIKRETIISPYSSLQLQVSVSALKMDNGDVCTIWYQYDDDTFAVLHTFDPPDVNLHHYFDTICDFPSAVGRTNITIWLQNSAGYDDYCYFDNVYLKGIPPTPNPTPKPTVNPSKRPTPKPTPKPTVNPSKRPTSNPTKIPTTNTTPRPTDPVGTWTCGDTTSGAYHGQPVTFVVNLPYDGSLQFNAAGSSFVVTDIEAFTNLNVALATDADNDEEVTLYDKPAGDYKFIINGEGTSSGTFKATIACFSADPTAHPLTPAPTQSPVTPPPTPKPSTDAPTPRPTSHPTTSHTHSTTKNPTKIPTDEPVHHPITQSPIAPSDDPTVSPIMQSTMNNEVADNSANHSELPLEIITGAAVVCICLVVLVIVCGKRLMPNGNWETQEHKQVQIQQMISVNLNSDNSKPKPQSIEKYDITELIEWLTNDVKLPQYAQNFADNGFETLDFVCDISAEDLQTIGVALKGHQIRILAQVKKLKAGQHAEDDRIVKEKPNQRQEHKPQRSVLDELEGQSEVEDPLTLEGSPHNDNLFGMGSLSLDQPCEDLDQAISPK